MATNVSMTVDMKKAMKRMDSVESHMRNPKEGMQIVAIKSERGVLDNFNDEQGRKRQWVKWNRKKTDGSREFFSSRPTKRGGTKLLQDTGLLRGSIKNRAIKNEAHVYTKTGYAKYHEFGTKKMVKRDFLWLPQDKINKIAKQFIKFIVGK